MNRTELMSACIERVRQALYFAALTVAVGSIWAVALAQGREADGSYDVNRAPACVATPVPTITPDAGANGDRP